MEQLDPVQLGLMCAVGALYVTLSLWALLRSRCLLAERGRFVLGFFLLACIPLLHLVGLPVLWFLLLDDLLERLLRLRQFWRRRIAVLMSLVGFLGFDCMIGGSILYLTEPSPGLWSRFAVVAAIWGLMGTQAGFLLGLLLPRRVLDGLRRRMSTEEARP